MARTASGVRGLVGDVGGTNARFAIAEATAGGIRLSAAKTLQAAEFKSGDAAVRAYLEPLGADAPKLAVIAAAGPVHKGAVTFTNNTAWRFSESELQRAGGLSQTRLINDFTAQALAIAHFKPGDTRVIGPRLRPAKRATAVILGPGTGFGAAARVDDGHAVAIATGEGGHAGFAPTDALEVEIARWLVTRFERVSIERVLSGPGLVNLHGALAEIRGETAPACEPAEITRMALAGEPLCRLALERFCAILGAAAGDFALAFGARGGVYLSGGIAPDILDFLAASEFRQRFEAKGRLSSYVQAIPTRVVMQPHAALIGAASLLGELES